MSHTIIIAGATFFESAAGFDLKTESSGKDDSVYIHRLK